MNVFVGASVNADGELLKNPTHNKKLLPKLSVSGPNFRFVDFTRARCIRCRILRGNAIAPDAIVFEFQLNTFAVSLGPEHLERTRSRRDAHRAKCSCGECFCSIFVFNLLLAFDKFVGVVVAIKKKGKHANDFLSFFFVYFTVFNETR